MYQKLFVYNYEVVKILTADGHLLRKWKEFFSEFGLNEDSLVQLQKRFNTFEPVEDIWTEMLENWRLERRALGIRFNDPESLRHITRVLVNLGFVKVAEKLDRLFCDSTWNSEFEHELGLNRASSYPDNSTGLTYEKLFSQFLESDRNTNEICEVSIQDPWLQSANQLNNLAHFLAFLQLNYGSTLKRINVTLRIDSRKDRMGLRKVQLEFLSKLLLEYESDYGIQLKLIVDNTIQNSIISFGNGKTIRSDHGLDIYYQVEPNSEAWTNLELRKIRPVSFIFSQN